jgi:FKBP-type peptidyl-prolyl cis-trans isomerase SlyD
MKAQIVSFHCVLKNQLGRVISSTFNHDVVTYSVGQSSVLKGLADGLQNLQKGEKRRIFVSAKDAYGFYDPAKVITQERETFSKALKICAGDELMVTSVKGKRSAFRVVDVSGEVVTLDGNHPLAGQDLVFEIEATDARDATPEEILEASSPEKDEQRPSLH